MEKKIFITLSIILLLLIGIEGAFAALTIPWSENLQNASIKINQNISGSSANDVSILRTLAGSLLSVARFIVSGFALIYLVLIGVNMVIFSEDDATIAKQKKQILYTIFAFLFLIVPDLVYRIFMPSEGKTIQKADWTGEPGTNTFVNQTGNFSLNAMISWTLDLFKVIAFAGAIFMLAWGAFGLIISRGKEEYKTSAINRLTYSILGLLFLGIVEAWTFAVQSQNLQEKIANVAGNIFGMAFFFAAPVAIFFLILGAYYYITSGGNEERAKKGKNIFFYTFIATIILIAGSTFLNELVNLLSNTK